MQNSEQRHFHRIPFDALVNIQDSGDGQNREAQLMDISLKGALVSRPAHWQAKKGQHVELDIQLNGAEPDVKLMMKASIAHIEEDRIGFKCEHMDLDTATHLHRLVELNLGDELLLERDLAELIGVKPV